jgi:hypothetical protein
MRGRARRHRLLSVLFFFSLCLQLAARSTVHSFRHSQNENPMNPVNNHARKINTGPAAPVSVSAHFSTRLKQRMTMLDAPRMTGMVASK